MGNPFEDLKTEFNRCFSELKSELMEVKTAVQKSSSNKHYTVQEISANTGLCDQTIRKLFKNGMIKGKRLGRKYIVSQDEFDRICSDVKTLKYQRT
jgi:excisionase family DNA binding protein